MGRFLNFLHLRGVSRNGLAVLGSPVNPPSLGGWVYSRNSPSVGIFNPYHLADLQAYQNSHKMGHYKGAMCKHPTTRC